jgi:hypothetical protein
MVERVQAEVEARRRAMDQASIQKTREQIRKQGGEEWSSVSACCCASAYEVGMWVHAARPGTASASRCVYLPTYLLGHAGSMLLPSSGSSAGRHTYR